MKGTLVFLLGLLALIIFMFRGFASVPDAEIVRAEHVYQVSYGRVSCFLAESESCGLKLAECDDGFVYRCLRDVRYEDK